MKRKQKKSKNETRETKNEPNKAKQNKKQRWKKGIGCPFVFSLGVYLDTCTHSEFGHPVTL